MEFTHYENQSCWSEDLYPGNEVKWDKATGRKYKTAQAANSAACRFECRSHGEATVRTLGVTADGRRFVVDCLGNVGKEIV